MRWSALTAVSAAAAAGVLLSCDNPLQPPAREAPLAPSLALAGTATSGNWSAPFSWPIVAAHLGVLPDGRVITWVSGYVPGGTEQHHIHVWNPSSGLFTEVTGGTHNAFCSGNAFLPDGRLLVPGGHITDNTGIKDTQIFNWVTNSWETAPPMRAGRWYPTATTLANGYVSIVAGSDENSASNIFPEIWDGVTWRLLAGAPLQMPYYPWMHPAPDGRVFNSGPGQITSYLNPSGSGEWTESAHSNGGYREYGGSIMYAPGKILIVGGGNPPINTAETIDLNTRGGWQFTGSMQNARRQMNSTVLPDGKVLVIGGTKGAGFNNESGAVLAPELWDPQTGAWTTLASMQIPRLYHSAAVLLPDARVLAAGGGRCSSCTVDHLDAELFSPPYLFAADGSPAVRPTISGAPTSVSYGEAFTVQTPDASTIGRVTWVRLPVTTHTFNQNQWINQLAFTGTAGGVTVIAPANAYLAPPGHYMLFILNGSGVPSVAKIVQLQGSAALPPAPAQPSTPTNLVAMSIDAQQIRLNWTDNSTSETEFLIEKCLGDGCTNFAQVARVDPQVSVYQLGSLVTGTAYTFRVRARNDAGYSGYSNSATGTTTTGGTYTVRTIMSQLAGKCVEVDGGRQLNGTRIFITPCASAPKYQWRVPPPGYEGDIRIFGTKCFDAAGGYGNPGDKILLWECHYGPNQRWTLTPAGELKGASGLCVTLDAGAIADRTGMSIQSCNGTRPQKWSYGSPGGDLPPVAQFSYACTTWTCDFNSSASTDDQGIASRAWSFGDGTTAGNVISPHKVYTGGGTYRVTLTVTDIAGQSTTKSQDVLIVLVPPNQAPVAAFTPRCTGLTCTFADGSTDGDGTVATRSWNFGDGGTSTAISPSHTYKAGGTYTVNLTVTDDKGATGSVSKPVTSTVSTSPIGLSATGRADATTQYMSLKWTGARGTRVDIYRNGGLLRTTANDGSDSNGRTFHGTASYVFKVCEAGTKTCSNEATVQFGGAPSPGNVPPTANFTSTCSNLSCTFVDRSADTDGTLAAWSWTFGDGSTSNTRNPSRTYAAAGTYTVTLTARDNLGATNQRSVKVTVPAARSSIVLSATARADATTQYMSLKWTGARGTMVDIYRNGGLLRTTANDGSDSNGRRFHGAAAYAFKLCEAGTTICSNQATVVFK